MVDEKKFLDQSGVEYLWSQLSLEDYPNNETLIAILNAIDTTKQDKNLIVTKGADGLSTHSPAEILEAVNNGINVYYAPNTSAGTLHPYLEGSNQTSYFHSNYIDNSRVIATGFLIDVNKNITVSNYSGLDNYYNKTEVDAFHDTLEDYVDNQVAALVNAAPETLDTLGELAAAFEENKEVVDALDASITNKQDKIADTLILVDTVTGLQHKIQIQNGQLVSFPVE